MSISMAGRPMMRTGDPGLPTRYHHCVTQSSYSRPFNILGEQSTSVGHSTLAAGGLVPLSLAPAGCRHSPMIFLGLFMYPGYRGTPPPPNYGEIACLVL